MVQIKILAAALILSSLTLGIGPIQGDDSPEGCVRSLIAAINAREDNIALRYLAAGKQVKPSLIKSLLRTGLSYRILSAKALVEGNDAAVFTDVAISNQPSRVVHDLFRLTKMDGSWKVVPLQIELLDPLPPSLLTAVLVQGNELQVFDTPPSPPKPDCLQNIKHLGIGSLMYAADYDDELPPSDHWRSDLIPYVEGVTLFHCPDDQRKGAISYRMSDFLSRVFIPKISDPSKIILLYEGEGGKLAARHDGKGSVCYADGHAAQITPEEFLKGYRKP